MTITITLHVWYLLVYLGVGAALFLPLLWWARSKMYNPPPFRTDLRRARKDLLGVLLSIACWPLAVWEVASL